MVKYSKDGHDGLGQTFAALSDPTRRTLLARLGEAGQLSVSDLAAPLAMSLPAVMKHLDVLSNAGLVARHKVGRTVRCQLRAAPMEDAMNWLARYQHFWSQQLDRLAAFVEEKSCPPQPSPSPAPPPSQASLSNVVSMRPLPPSTRRGPTRKS